MRNLFLAVLTSVAAFAGSAQAQDIEKALAELCGPDQEARVRAVEVLKTAGARSLPHLLEAWESRSEPLSSAAAAVLVEMPRELAAWRLPRELVSLEPPKQERPARPSVPSPVPYPTPTPSPKPLGWREPKAEDAALGERWFARPGADGVFLMQRIERRKGGGYRCVMFLSAPGGGDDPGGAEMILSLDASLVAERIESRGDETIMAGTSTILAVLPLLCAGLDRRLAGSAGFPCSGFRFDPKGDSRNDTLVLRFEKGSKAFLTDNLPDPAAEKAKLELGENGSIRSWWLPDRPMAEIKDPSMRFRCRTGYAFFQNRQAAPSDREANPLVELGAPAWPELMKRLDAVAEGSGDEAHLLKAARLVARQGGEQALVASGRKEILGWWKSVESRFSPWSKGWAGWQIGVNKVTDFECLLPPGYGVVKTNEATDFRIHSVKGRKDGAYLRFVVAAHPPRLPAFPDRVALIEGEGEFRAGRTEDGLFWGEGRSGGTTFTFETRDHVERCLFLGIARSLDY